MGSIPTSASVSNAHRVCRIERSATNREGVVQLHGWVPSRLSVSQRSDAGVSIPARAGSTRSPGSISIDACVTSRTDRGQHPGTPPSGRSSARRAPVWETGGRRGRSCRPDHRIQQRVAQLEERQHRKLEAAGAGPVTLTAGSLSGWSFNGSGRVDVAHAIWVRLPSIPPHQAFRTVRNHHDKVARRGSTPRPDISLAGVM